MTIADLSVILAKVQVDETDVVRLRLGDSVRVTIDAFPDTSFVGRVTKISNSAQLTATATAAGSSDRAVDFDVEVTLDQPAAGHPARPERHRQDRHRHADPGAQRADHRAHRPAARGGAQRERPATAAAAPPPPATGGAGKKKDTEGVFVVRDGVAMFTPVKVGIAGEEYFEVLERRAGGRHDRGGHLPDDPRPAGQHQGAGHEGAASRREDKK